MCSTPDARVSYDPDGVASCEARESDCESSAEMYEAPEEEKYKLEHTSLSNSIETQLCLLLGIGLTVRLSGLAAGYTIGIVANTSVRVTAQQSGLLCGTPDARVAYNPDGVASYEARESDCESSAEMYKAPEKRENKN